MHYSICDGTIQTYGLEVPAAQHCNLRCLGCSQRSPFLQAGFPDLRLLEVTLARLRDVLHADRVTVLGGEPLLNPCIVDLLRVVRDSRVGNRIFVGTNGLLLADVNDEFWELVDVVQISIYPATRDRVIRGIERLFSRAWESGTEVLLLPTPTFRRITLLEPILDDRVVADLYCRCYFRHYCHTVQDGKLYRCAPSVNVERDTARRHPDCRLTDPGVAIDESPDLAQRVLAYLEDIEPMDVCRYCIGSSGVKFPHRQMKPEEIAEPATDGFCRAYLSDGD